MGIISSYRTPYSIMQDFQYRVKYQLPCAPVQPWPSPVAPGMSRRTFDSFPNQKDPHIDPGTLIMLSLGTPRKAPPSFLNPQFLAGSHALASPLLRAGKVSVCHYFASSCHRRGSKSPDVGNIYRPLGPM